MNKILATISLAVVAAFSQQLSAKDYIITSHGVKNDSTKIQTTAIQKVIDQAEADGGGRIVVPKAPS